MKRLVSFSDKKENIIESEDSIIFIIRTKNQHNRKHDLHILVTIHTVT